MHDRHDDGSLEQLPLCLVDGVQCGARRKRDVHRAAVTVLDPFDRRIHDALIALAEGRRGA
jgi:hypothetical protein